MSNAWTKSLMCLRAVYLLSDKTLHQFPWISLYINILTDNGAITRLAQQHTLELIQIRLITPQEVTMCVHKWKIHDMCVFCTLVQVQSHACLALQPSYNEEDDVMSCMSCAQMSYLEQLRCGILPLHINKNRKMAMNINR